MGIFGKNSVAGVEIDAYEIRVVELGGSAGAPRLLRAGKKALAADAVKDGRILRPELVSEALASLWQEAGFGTRDIMLGVNNQDVLVRFAFFPKVSQDRVDNLIRYQAQDFLPIPVSDVELDYVIVGEEKEGDSVQMKVLLVAARRNMIYDFLNAFEKASLRILDIDMSTLAIARLLPAHAAKGTCAVINIGYEQTNILLLNSSHPHLARSFTTGQRQAAGEEPERNSLCGCLRSGNPSVEDIEPAFQAIAGEIRTSISYFQSQMPNAVVDRIHLCGCGSRIHNLPYRLEEYSGIPVGLLKPFERLNLMAAKSPVNINEAGDYSVCVSLALRGLEV